LLAFCIQTNSLAKAKRRDVMPTRNHIGKSAGDTQGETERFDTSSLATKAAEKTNGAASVLERKAEQATEAVGVGMESLGQTIRQHKPEGGVLGNAGEAVAKKLEAGGHYLEEKGLKGIGEDITSMIRRNPVPALLIGMGVGFLVARMMRR
jgi:hypothetical protein